MKTEAQIVLEMAKIVDQALEPRQAFEVINDMASVEGIERNTREALLTLIDEIHERKW